MTGDRASPHADEGASSRAAVRSLRCGPPSWWRANERPGPRSRSRALIAALLGARVAGDRRRPATAGGGARRRRRAVPAGARVEHAASAAAGLQRADRDRATGADRARLRPRRRPRPRARSAAPPSACCTAPRARSPWSRAATASARSGRSASASSRRPTPCARSVPAPPSRAPPASRCSSSPCCDGRPTRRTPRCSPPASRRPPPRADAAAGPRGASILRAGDRRRRARGRRAGTLDVEPLVLVGDPADALVRAVRRGSGCSCSARARYGPPGVVLPGGAARRVLAERALPGAARPARRGAASRLAVPHDRAGRGPAARGHDVDRGRDVPDGRRALLPGGAAGARGARRRASGSTRRR